MMTRTIAAIGLLFALSASVHAQNFYTPLGMDGLQESPPVVTTGSGYGTAEYDAMTNMLTVHVEFSDLIANAQDAHIHCCFVDRITSPNASVALGFTTAGFPFGVTSGIYDHVFDMGLNATYTNGFRNGPGGGTANGARDALLAGMTNGHAYFNIHTSFRPGGEIRGDIFAVPEPSSLLMLACGMAAIGFARRNR